MIFIITFFLLFLALTGLGIGYFLTGKSKLHKKCGSTIKTGSEEGECDLCGKKGSCSNSQE
jgi:hypothetical protein